MFDPANRVARYTAVTLVSAGVLVCIGWQFRIAVLKGASFGTFVSPNAALLFGLVGVSCLLQLSPRNLLVTAGQVLGLLIAAFSLAIVAEYLIHVDLHVDRLFLAHRLAEWNLPTPPGRPAFPTILAFAFAGLGLIDVRRRRARHVADWCAAVVATISYLGVIGYAYSLPKLYGGLMALHTAILLGVVALALATVRSDSIVMSVHPGGMVFRRVITPLLVLMPLLGFIGIRAQQAFSLSLEMGAALLVVVAVFIFAAITAHTAGVVNALDLKRKRAEESLVRAEKLAAAGRLSATIAHEMNNALASLMNLLYLARTTEDTSTAAEYLRTAENELRTAAEIAKRTLGFYRDDAQPADVILASVTRQVLDLFHSKTTSSNIKVQTELQCNAVVRVRAGEIRQIITNLLGNAIDAVQGQREPTISVTVRERSRVVQLVVRDNGSGVSSTDRERIFEPFFTTKKKVGTGLGLYTSRQLAEKNGGSLYLGPTESGTAGTTFYLTLPLVSVASKSLPMATAAT